MNQLKNVILVYSHNTSAYYLSGENLKDVTFGMAPNLCSTCILEKTEENLPQYFIDIEQRDSTREGFQTEDGLQYWHFKHKEPRYGQDWEEGKQDEEDLRCWVEKLERELANKEESIDAVVFPLGLCLSLGTYHFLFMEDMKHKYPHLKIIVHNQHLLSTDSTFDAAAWPKNKNAEIHDGITPVCIRRGQRGQEVADNGQAYEMRPYVDAITCNGNDEMKYDLLRAELNMASEIEL